MTEVSLLTVEEVTALREDISRATSPISHSLSQTTSPVNSDMLLIYELTIEELSTSLRYLSPRLHPLIFDSLWVPLQDLAQQLSSLQQQTSAGTSDPSSMSSVQEWVKADSGQWKLSIPGELLLELVELGFRDADIAIMLDCSPGTIYRRRKEMGIEKWNTSIDEQALIEHLVKLRSMHSDTVGERGTMGALN
ncbi:unnamed protein product, partial [Tilletia controversa]